MNYCENCETTCRVRFCSRKCNITFQNKNRDTSFSKDLKPANCVKCNIDLTIKKQQSTSSAQCQSCKLAKIQQRLEKTCLDCRKQFNALSTCAKFCQACRKLRAENAGRKSAAIQALTRRSWSEIELGKLCLQHFSTVTFNDPIFPNDPPTETHWDADILLHDHQVAVLWNGPWHYKKLRSRHSVEQVQRRDKIKLARIIASGWRPFVIQDEIGSKDIAKVQLAFNDLLKFIATS